MAECYSASLPGGFYAPIRRPINMKSKRNRDKRAIDLENIFVRLMMIGQRRKLELGPLLDYELSAVPTSVIDEQECLRKGNTSALVKRLGVIECTPASADIVIGDVHSCCIESCGRVAAVLPM